MRFLRFLHQLVVIVSMSVVMIVMPVTIAMIIVPMSITMAMIVTMRIPVLLVLAIVIPVIMPNFTAIFVSVPVMLPAPMTSPVCALAAHRIRAVITKSRIVGVIDVSSEAYRTTEPRSRTQKHSARKPLRPVVAKRCAVIRRVVVVPVRAHRRGANLYIQAHLRLCLQAGRDHSRRYRQSCKHQSQCVLQV